MSAVECLVHRPCIHCPDCEPRDDTAMCQACSGPWVWVPVHELDSDQCDGEEARYVIEHGEPDEAAAVFAQQAADRAARVDAVLADVMAVAA